MSLRVLLLIVFAACGPAVPIPDGGTPVMMMMATDAGNLGPPLSCRVTIVGALSNSFGCESTATFARGSPNATSITISGNRTTRNPELDFTLRFPLEATAGTSFGWANDVLSGDLLLTDVPNSNSFLASKAMSIDPFSFSLRVNEVTGRLSTSSSTAQLRFTYQLDATLVPSAGSTAPNNARVTVMVTR